MQLKLAISEEAAAVYEQHKIMESHQKGRLALRCAPRLQMASGGTSANVAVTPPLRGGAAAYFNTFGFFSVNKLHMRADELLHELLWDGTQL